MKPKGSQFSQRPFSDIEPSFAMKPTDEHRWPRGYGPERQQQAAAVFGHPSSYSVENGDWGDLQTLRARTVDTVARSSVDLSQMHSRQLVTPYPGAEEPVVLTHTVPHIKQVARHNGLLGSYSSIPGSGEDAGDVMMHPDITLYGDVKNPLRTVDEQHTLLHELGHHASAVLGNEHSPGARLAKARLKGENSTGNTHTAKMMGREEGFAERHAAETLRPRRGEEVPGRGAYPASTYGFYGAKEKTFDKHFSEAHYDNPLSTGETPRERERSTSRAMAWRAVGHSEQDVGRQPELGSEGTALRNPEFGDNSNYDWKVASAKRLVRGHQAVDRLNQMGYRGHHTFRPNRET